VLWAVLQANRLRIQPERAFLWEQEAARDARRAEQWKRWRRWTRKLLSSCGLNLLEPARMRAKAMRRREPRMRSRRWSTERPTEVAAILGSPDRERVRGAVYALSIVPKIPAAVTPALIEAGSQVASCAASARDMKAGSPQDEAEAIAWDFFERWTQAIERALPPRDNARYQVLMDGCNGTFQSDRGVNARRGTLPAAAHSVHEGGILREGRCEEQGKQKCLFHRDGVICI